MSSKREINNIANLITEDANSRAERLLIKENSEATVTIKDVPLPGGYHGKVEYRFLYDTYGGYERPTQFDPGDDQVVEIYDVNVDGIIAYDGANNQVGPRSDDEQQRWIEAAVDYFDNELVDRVSEQIVQSADDQPYNDDNSDGELPYSDYAHRLPY